MTIPGGYTAGDVLTAADMNLLPAGVLDYATKTDGQYTITSAADITGLAVTWTAVANRVYRVTGFGLFSGSTANRTAFVIANSSNTAQSTTIVPTISSGAGQDTGAIVQWVGTVSAGSTTFKMRAECIGSGSISLTAAYSFMSVEDIGPEP